MILPFASTAVTGLPLQRLSIDTYVYCRLGISSSGMGALAALMAASGRGGGMESLSESEFAPDGGGRCIDESQT